MSASAPCPPDHPLMIAWNVYKATEDYANNKKWATHSEHVEGSLWGAFMAGFIAQSGVISDGAAMLDQAQKAALHAQEECLKAQDVCMKAQEGERVALSKRAEAVTYAVAQTQLLDRALKMMQMAGYGVAPHDADHNNPVIAWMAEARELLAKNQCGGSGSLSETPRPSTAHPLPAGLKPDKQLDGGPSASGPATQPEPRTICHETGQTPFERTKDQIAYRALTGANPCAHGRPEGAPCDQCDEEAGRIAAEQEKTAAEIREHHSRHQSCTHTGAREWTEFWARFFVAAPEDREEMRSEAGAMLDGMWKAVDASEFQVRNEGEDLRPGIEWAVQFLRENGLEKSALALEHRNLRTVACTKQEGE